MQPCLCVWCTKHAIQCNTCPDVTALELWIIQETITALDVGFGNVDPLLFEPVDHLVKSCYLLACEKDILLVWTVRRTEVCVNAIDVQIFHMKYPGELLHFFIGIFICILFHGHPKSQPVHSCVQLDMCLDRNALRIQPARIIVVRQSL